MKMHMLSCAQKWLSGEFPGSLGYCGFKGIYSQLHNLMGKFLIISLSLTACWHPVHAVLLTTGKIWHHWTHSQKSKSKFWWTCHSCYAVHVYCLTCYKHCAMLFFIEYL